MRLKYWSSLLLFAGCASPYIWAKHGATPADYDRDLARCRYEAASATASYSSGRVAPTMGGAIAQGLGEGMAIGMRRTELIELCLQANGYSKRTATIPVVSTQSVSTVAPSPPTNVATPSGGQAVRPPDPEMEKVVQLLSEQKFPLSGDPVRFKTVSGRTYYEAKGGGRLTQVICQDGSCRIRTTYD